MITFTILQQYIFFRKTNIMKTFLTYVLTILVVLCLISQTITAQCHINDWTALKVFYENASNWRKSNGWSATFKNHSTPPKDCNLGDVLGINLNNTFIKRYLYIEIKQERKHDY